MELEKQIRELQKELSDAQKERSVLRLQPCSGDAEIRKKDEKLDELDTRAKNLQLKLRDLIRKRQILTSGSNPKGIYEVHVPGEEKQGA
ncbi:MAG TPA: hypothetical protein VLS90_04025 [Thermodesulfobacteriota bacterium]|nr:hypothetical protein [Thermodesulfobacteriota bacterium]